VIEKWRTEQREAGGRERQFEGTLGLEGEPGEVKE